MSFSLDLITGFISLFFTILIFSYLIGDNPLFRIAAYIFVGVSAGYVAAIAVWQVIVPRLVYPILFGSFNEKIFASIPLLGGLFIMMKVSSRLSGIARLTMAFLVGAGAAVTIAGAVVGTLIPQVNATINMFDLNAAASMNIGKAEALGNGAVIFLGTILTMVYFHFGASPKTDGSMRRLGLIEIAAWLGRIFIGITLGAIFAGVYAAALTALIERIASMSNFILNLLGNF
ncbi:MAG: hypothetical protein IH588_05340 [Anaerolineales bacterium]|nr:hypothetical protein [Anaerolineales bacterium]